MMHAIIPPMYPAAAAAAAAMGMLFFVCPAKTMYRLDQRRLPRSFVPHHSGGCGVAWRTNLLWTPAATNERHEREPGLGAAILEKVFFFSLRWKSVGVGAMRATNGVFCSS